MGAGLSASQQSVATRAIRRAQKRRASPMERKALVEAGLVESNLEELSGGDRDSTGFLQQRPSQGWGPAGESVEKDVDQFLNAARKVKGQAKNAGQLAQMVQRSAFPDRYGQRGGDADRILRSLGGASGPSPTSSSAQLGTKQMQMPGTSHLSDRVNATMDFLDGGDVVDFATQMSQLQDEPGKTVDVTTLDVVKGKPAPKRAARTKGKLDIAEMYYDPGISLDSGKRVGAIGGHGDHVHVASTNGDTMMELYRLAQSMGLRVGEFDGFEHVDPVHAKGSYHYSDTKTSKGRKVGEAMDVSGDPKKMAAFNRAVARRAK